MIPFAKIAGGPPSAMKGLTAHLQNQTLTARQEWMAQYYQRGGGMDQDRAIRAVAELVADDELTYSEGLGRLMSDWLRSPGRDIDRWQEQEEMFALRLADVAGDLQDGKEPPVRIAVLRPDIHPLVLRGFGLDDGKPLDNDRINALIAGRRADGEKIDGKRYAVTHSRRDPATGEERSNQPLGSMDFAPSPHKSVSVAWAFAGPVEQSMIFNAHIEAAREAVSYITTEIGQARIGEGGQDGRAPGHVGWLEFTHHTSRRTVTEIKDGAVHFEKTEQRGDMDLHTHFLVPNAVFCDDGRVGSLDTAALGGFIMEADGHYQALLRQKLEAAGFDVGWDERTGAARMNTVTDDICAVFSKRTNMGEALARKMVADKGGAWDDLSAAERAAWMKSATQDRRQKVLGDKDDVADVEDWLRQAKAAGWEPPASFMAQERAVALDHEQRIRQAYEIGLPWLDEKLQHQSVLKHWDARCAALRGLVATGGYQGLDDVTAVTKLMREEGVQQYGEKTALLWGREAGVRHVSISTALHEAHETEFLTLAKAAASDRGGAFTAREIDAAARRSGLDFGSVHGRTQLKAIHVLGEGGRFGVAVGTAGAGKSAMLKVLTIAAERRGIDVWGASLAWRQADDMVDGGIAKDRVKAFSVLLDGLKDGSISLGAESLLAVDELGLLGTRQGLELLRLREQHGFSLVALGDDKQCASIEAGNIISLCRRALSAEQVPEILTTIRQQTERERRIVGLIREGQPREALDMKRSDGTAEMVAGGYDQLVQRVATLYGERLRETGKVPTISAPTNSDAHKIGVAVREERRKMGLIGPDIRTVRATDGEREYRLALAAGDHLRLFKSTGARLESGRGGRIGRNGSVVEVVSMDDHGIKLRALKTDAVGTVKWSDLVERDGRMRLAYGSALTIHTAQGLTSGEHIFALPAGSQAITGATGYTAMTRHRLRSYLLTSDVAERAAVRASRPINDPREITLDDKWTMMAKALVNQPVKDLAVNMAERVQTLKRGMVKQFQQAMHPAEQRKRQGLSPSHAPEKAQGLRLEKATGLGRVRDVAIETMRQVRQHASQHVRDLGYYLGR